MRVKLRAGPEQRKFIERIEELSGEDIFACYQCGRCSAGCPVALEMDILPNQVIRLIQLGLAEEVLGSKTLFLCASCFTCQSRCPKGIDMARVMEAVRHLLEPKGKDVCGPDEITPELAKELPQQVLVSLFRKFSK
ncbi:MAG: 4Fe-4S dicluster domain-containing protein [Acidobacteriota bacterium]|nr:4Fe-4S dicluster domain-containing protein [Acidobacteriota bacterium]